MISIAILQVRYFYKIIIKTISKTRKSTHRKFEEKVRNKFNLRQEVERRGIGGKPFEEPPRTENR
jgi:coproporphyrinogen III oxidase